MSFCDTFADLRKRRRISTRDFSSVEIPSSYIHSIERGGRLPSAEKLDKIASVFVAVAREQGAADPEGDARLLTLERKLTRFERLAREWLKDLETEEAAPLNETLERLQGLGMYERADLAEEFLPELSRASPEAFEGALDRLREAEDRNAPDDRETTSAR